jgi:hypothetical protein
MRRGLWTVALAACGRIGFGDRDPMTQDAMVDATGNALTLSGQLGHWSFDEASGPLAGDSLGGLPIMLMNGPIRVPGVVGNAVSADGVDDWAITPMLDLSATATTTVALWVRRTYTLDNSQVLFELGPNFNNSTTGFGLFPDNNAACVGVFTGLVGDVDYSTRCHTQPSSDDWHHIAVIYDKAAAGAAEITLFVDGVETPSTLSNIHDNTNPFANDVLYLFARGGVTEFLAGEIDELRVFDRGLTAAEVLAVYQAR